MYKISFYVVLFSLSTYSSSALLIAGFGWQAYRSGIHRVSMRLYIWLARRSSHFAIFAIKWVAAMQMGRLRKLREFSILIVHRVALLLFGFLSFFSSSFVSPLIFSFYFFVIRQLGVSSCGTQPKPKSWFIVNNSANGPGAHCENCGYLWLARAGLIPKSSSSHWCAIFPLFVFIFPNRKKRRRVKTGGTRTEIKDELHYLFILCDDVNWLHSSFSSFGCCWWPQNDSNFNCRLGPVGGKRLRAGIHTHRISLKTKEDCRQDFHCCHWVRNNKHSSHRLAGWQAGRGNRW